MTISNANDRRIWAGREGRLSGLVQLPDQQARKRENRHGGELDTSPSFRIGRNTGFRAAVLIGVHVKMT
jgi:hypothetical protein